MMYKLFLLAVCLAVCRAEVTLDDVIRELQRRKQMTSGGPILATRNGAGAGADRSCRTVDGAAGECVPYYLCRNGTIVEDGMAVIDIRVNNPECESYLDVCCLLRDRREPSTVLAKTGCGWLNTGGVGLRITGALDREANFGEIPWMVAVLRSLYEDQDQPTAYLSGGSLIHPSVVLTAAHYVHNVTARFLTVRAGEWDTSTIKEPYPYQEKKVQEVVVHGEFNLGNVFNDIALLFLREPVSVAPHVGLACLPAAGARPAHGERCLVSGWGKDLFAAGRYQAILKKVEVPAVGHRRCQSLLRGTRLGRRFRLHRSFVCAGGEGGRDACTGDGGSPLVCPSERAGRYVQHGVVSWGIGCGGAAPGVYASVGALRAWVDGHVTRRGYDPAAYTLTEPETTDYE